MSASTPAKKAAPKSNTSADKRKLEQQQDTIKEFMATGVDFSPFTLDVGDGVRWNFTPDPQPHETEKLSQAMKNLSEAQTAQEGISDAFDVLKEAIRDRIMDDEQRKEFPKPLYGSNALMWFALHLATGRDGFPTE